MTEQKLHTHAFTFPRFPGFEIRITDENFRRMRESFGDRLLDETISSIPSEAAYVERLFNIPRLSMPVYLSVYGPEADVVHIADASSNGESNRIRFRCSYAECSERVRSKTRVHELAHLHTFEYLESDAGKVSSEGIALAAGEIFDYGVYEGRDVVGVDELRGYAKRYREQAAEMLSGLACAEILAYTMAGMAVASHREASQRLAIELPVRLREEEDKYRCFELFAELGRYLELPGVFRHLIRHEPSSEELREHSPYIGKLKKLYAIQ
ncbi:MAG TPA: hypothetical protein VLD37_03060 [Candidatus Bilamarchaeum sp.]|nr:hypothetical protein [Candidatus Bilamarchaeum sp.]